MCNKLSKAIVASALIMVAGAWLPYAPQSAYAEDKKTEQKAEDSVKAVTDATFDKEVLKSDKPVLVDFWAPWCGPCRRMSPVVEEVATQLDGKLKVVKMNTDENQKTAQAYKITGIPALYVFKKGQLVEQVVGAVPKQDLLNAVNKHL